MVPGSPLHSAGFAILLGVSSWHLAVTPAASSTDERTRGEYPSMGTRLFC